MPEKILWVCAKTGNIALTDINEVPASPTLTDHYKHDWVPIQVLNK